MPMLVNKVWRSVHTELVTSRFARDVGALTIANLVSAALSFLQGIIVARLLGPNLYGVAALLISYPNLVFAFFDARSAEASIKYLSEFHARGQKDRALAMCKLGYAVDFGIATVTSLAVTVTARWAAGHIVHSPETAPLIALYAAGFLLRALSGTSQAALSVFGRFTTLAWLSALTTVMRSVSIVTLILLGFGVAGIVIGDVLASATMGLAYGVFAYGLVRKTWGGSWLQGSWQALRGRRRDLMRFIFYNDLNALLGIAVNQLDVTLLGYFRGPTETGYYRLAKSLATVVGYVVEPLRSATYPRLAHLWGKGDKRGFKRVVRRLALLVGLPLGGLAAVGILVIPALLPLLVGEEFRQAVIAGQVLLAGSVVWLAFFWLRPLYFAQGRIKTWTWTGTFSLILLLPVSIASIRYSGYIGLSWWHFVLNLTACSIGLLKLKIGGHHNGTAY
jgi:O-antigen/teichoic acid export membrane protein